MIGNFKFNNIESDTFKLVCKSVKRPLLPAAKVKRVELPSTSGIHDSDGTEYGSRSITMKIQYIGTDYTELRTRARSIAAWLSTSNMVQLIIHDEPDKYYLARITDEIDLDSLYESGTADIAFDCQPFAYSTIEKTYNLGAGVNTFNNPGTRLINYKSPQGSKFIITTSGACTISMNGNTLTINTAGIIDNIEMEATSGGVNKFDALSGDVDTFLNIIPGNNSIITTGAVTINFIPMWI